MQAKEHTKKYFEKAGVQIKRAEDAEILHWVENFSLLIISHLCKQVQQLPPS